MRLRYLHLHGLPPLADIEIVFGHEAVLSRQCAIRFVVGVNGSGKTRLLQAIAGVLGALERQQLPPYPVTLAYDLTDDGTVRTIYLHQPGDAAGSVLIEFEQRVPEEVDWARFAQVDWDRPPYTVRNRYHGNALPGGGEIDRLLPSLVLVYTSGATASWEALFAPQRFAELPVPELLDAELERPTGWTEQQERERRQREGDVSVEAEEPPSDGGLTEADFRTTSLETLMLPFDLRLAICAVTIQQAADDFAATPVTEDAEQAFADAISQKRSIEGVREPGLRGLLNEVEWLWPLTLTLAIDFQPAQIVVPQDKLLRRVYQVVTTVLREPGGGTGRSLIFDLRRPITVDGTGYASTAAALFDAFSAPLSQKRTTPMDVYRGLRELHRNGILRDVSLVLRKRNIRDPLLFDSLSDGERLFLGRMALFHLLHGTPNALIILDEPETHFNDVWKREIVNIVDDRLHYDPSEVIISTHSSIALTDVFDTEITLLKKAPTDGTVAAVRTPMRTFGASPNEIMIGIFDAPETVGQRATEFLDMILMLAAYPEEVQTLWEVDVVQRNGTAAMEEHPSFNVLLKHLAELPHYYGTPQEQGRMLVETLRSFRQYAERVRRQSPVRVADAVTALQDLLGPGFYQFEFRRRLRALRGPSTDATPR